MRRHKIHNNEAHMSDMTIVWSSFKTVKVKLENKDYKMVNGVI